MPNAPLSVEQLIEAVDNKTNLPTDLLNLEKRDPQPQTQPTVATPQPETAPPPNGITETPPSQETAEPSASAIIDLFQLFVCKIEKLTAEAPLKADEIASQLELEKSQVNAWLKRAVEEGLAEKLQRPVSYQITGKARKQASLF